MGLGLGVDQDINPITTRKMTILEAARKATKTQNTTLAHKVLDKMEQKGNPMDFPLICDINSCGRDGHKWAWDTLEDWQLED